jgi:hypothetical protein
LQYLFLWQAITLRRAAAGLQMASSNEPTS